MTTQPPTPALGYAGMVTDPSTGLNLTLTGRMIRG